VAVLLTFRQPPSAVEAAPGAGAVSASGWVERCRRTVTRWIVRSRQRQTLRDIAEANDLHLLKDIGVSRQEAFREADKPFWRP
jgi:uncharacterized protein YjiS (DUF1127 family)